MHLVKQSKMCCNYNMYGCHDLQKHFQTLTLAFIFSNCRLCLILFPKSFSHFPHGTCTSWISSMYHVTWTLPCNLHFTCKKCESLSTSCIQNKHTHMNITSHVVFFQKTFACSFDSIMPLVNNSLHVIVHRFSTWLGLLSFATTYKIQVWWSSSAY